MVTYDASILKAVEYIEANIHDELTLEKLAKEASFSKFHFTKIFKAIAKENINEYIRKRRLTLAATALINTETPIIHIAMEYGYTSQEAFSRPFKTYFGTTPQSYRKKAVHYRNLYKESLSNTMLQIKKQPVRCEPVIVEKSAMVIGGIVIKGNLQNHEISKLWNRFYEDLEKLSLDPETARCYGYESIDETNTPYYLAAIEVEGLVEVPENWTRVSVPGTKYVVFTVDNVIENLGIVAEEIYKTHLPALGLQPDQNYYFEFYHEDFTSHDDNYTIQIFVPIR
jgi:AraC family transcriptional regulator